jgi:hypothetical protein
LSPNELRERAGNVLAARSRSYVEDARLFAHAIVKLLGDYGALADQLTAARTRCTELDADRRTLKIAIERIASAEAVAREDAIAEAVVAAGGMP